MFLIVNKDKVIIASCNQEVNEEDCESRGETVLEISNDEFKQEMIGAIYSGD